MCLYMKKFIQESLQEFDHVVWPTQAETRKYFTVVVSMITICALVLFVFGSAVTNALFAVRGIVTPARPYVAPTEPTDAKTADILKRLKSATGATNSGATATGAVKTTTGSVNSNK